MRVDMLVVRNVELGSKANYQRQLLFELPRLRRVAYRRALGATSRKTGPGLFAGSAQSVSAGFDMSHGDKPFKGRRDYVGPFSDFIIGLFPGFIERVLTDHDSSWLCKRFA